jgi:hypothetical protein
MLALTLIRPWSCALARGPKCIENRSWEPPHSALGQLVAFHGGKKWDADGAASVDELWRSVPSRNESPEGIVGVGRLIGIIAPNGAIIPMSIEREARCVVLRIEGEEWYTGAWGWIFDERLAFADPIPCRGAQGLWTLPDYPALVVQGHVDVVAFNNANLVGTRVRYWKGLREGEGAVSHTRSRAQFGGGHGSGVAGSISLSHVEVLDAGACAP